VFRDYLRNHPARAREYQDLKVSLAGAHPTDLRRYTLEKATFVRQTLTLAYAAGKKG